MPSLSLVIPAFNEARRLPTTLRNVSRYLPGSPFDEAEVIVVDDGSRDGTSESARSEGPALAASGAVLRVLRNEANRGKGYSVRRGMREARHEWVLSCDADESAPIAEVEKLVNAAEAGGHAVAIGSRALDRSLIGIHQPRYRECVGRLFNLNARLATGLRVADTQCGFKLFLRQAAQRIAAKQRIERFGFDVEQLYIARKLGFSIAEVPVRWNNQPDSSVGLRDGLAAFADVWRVRWNDLKGAYS